MRDQAHVTQNELPREQYRIRSGGPSRDCREMIRGARRRRWPWSWLRGWFHTHRTHIDRRLHVEVGRGAIARYAVSQKDLPAFRFVDLYRAIDAHLTSFDDVRSIESDNSESLNKLLHGRGNRWDSRRITKSPRTAWTVGPDEEVFLPIDRYWIFSEGEACARAIVRLRYDREHETAVLALAGVDSDRVDALLKRLIADSTSIYRERLLTLSFESGARDQFGDVEKAECLRVSFAVAAPVSRGEFVVDQELHKLLWRNVVDLHERRQVLKTHGVPIRRGVLLYGPPGTGKTFACRYLCGQLPDTTRIVVAGSALNRIGQLFDFARTYQPSVVILEDVDLAFAARDISLYSSSLGDLLDQMDGLRPSDDVGVILTTNSIERLEAAIKDRPGRISQCVYFGPRRHVAPPLPGAVCQGVRLRRDRRGAAGRDERWRDSGVHQGVGPSHGADCDRGPGRRGAPAPVAGRLPGGVRRDEARGRLIGPHRRLPCGMTLQVGLHQPRAPGMPNREG